MFVCLYVFYIVVILSVIIIIDILLVIILLAFHRAFAESVLNDAEKVVKALAQAEVAQNAAEQAIDNATKDIEDAKEAIVQVRRSEN